MDQPFHGAFRFWMVRRADNAAMYNTVRTCRRPPAIFRTPSRALGKLMTQPCALPFGVIAGRLLDSADGGSQRCLSTAIITRAI